MKNRALKTEIWSDCLFLRTPTLGTVSRNRIGIWYTEVFGGWDGKLTKMSATLFQMLLYYFYVSSANLLKLLTYNQ